jgi:hypothetical protein
VSRQSSHSMSARLRPRWHIRLTDPIPRENPRRQDPIGSEPPIGAVPTKITNAEHCDDMGGLTCGMMPLQRHLIGGSPRNHA